MMLPWKPKPGSAPGFVQQIKEPGPPDFNMTDYVKTGVEMAAQRLVDGVRSGDTKTVVSALRNLIALMDCEEDMSESEMD